MFMSPISPETTICQRNRGAKKSSSSAESHLKFLLAELQFEFVLIEYDSLSRSRSWGK